MPRWVQDPRAARCGWSLGAGVPTPSHLRWSCRAPRASALELITPRASMAPRGALKRPARASAAKAAAKPAAKTAAKAQAKAQTAQTRAKGAENAPPSEVVASSFVAFLDVATDRGERSFATWAARVCPGMALVAPVYDSAGLTLGHCIFQVLQSIEHRTGRYLEAELISWSSSEARAEMRGIKEGGDVLLHLCKSVHSCKDSHEEGKVVHLREWKVVEPRQLDEDYLTASQRRLLDKMAPDPRPWNISCPSEDEDLSDSRPVKRRKTAAAGDSQPSGSHPPSRPADDGSSSASGRKRLAAALPTTPARGSKRSKTSLDLAEEPDDSGDSVEDDGGGLSVTQGDKKDTGKTGTGLMHRLLAKMQNGAAPPAKDDAEAATPLKSASVSQLRDMLAAKKATEAKARSSRGAATKRSPSAGSNLLSRIQALQDGDGQQRPMQ